ncbi:hypothetical protein [Numidum massiliense]|uniref:hypothetical protein n=1 Tax=Numidum massiliense TaxID=1522315 RepID=UPI0021C38DA4|nr:hypothetical protein [Numidum massiliense]
MFSRDVVEQFLTATGHLDVPILFGLMPLKSYKMARYVHEKVPGITLSDEALSRVQAGGREQGVQVVAELLTQIRPFVSGVHIYPLGDASLVEQLFAAVGESKGVADALEAHVATGAGKSVVTKTGTV